MVGPSWNLRQVQLRTFQIIVDLAGIRTSGKLTSKTAYSVALMLGANVVDLLCFALRGSECTWTSTRAPQIVRSVLRSRMEIMRV